MAKVRRNISDHFQSGNAIVTNAFEVLARLSSEQLALRVQKYSTGYLALRSLIRDRTDPRDELQLFAAGYAVYGWMPTMLNSISNFEQLSDFILEIKGCSFERLAPILQRKLQEDSGSVFRSLNNSVIGTSKLLHFFEPGLFPIWDSRIAGLFGFKYQKHNCPEAYVTYIKLLQEWQVTGGAIPRIISEVMSAGVPENDPLSKIRLAEFALFISAFGSGSIDVNQAGTARY